MSENCTHDCNSCSQNCSDFLVKPHKSSSIKKVIGVVSGKGGVGKSIVSSMLAVSMNRKGFKTAVLDADITGPSIPKSFGINQRAVGNNDGIEPVSTKSGINIMSVNLLLENDTDPVVWRGPVIAGMVKQFWSDVIWKDIDYMFIDMPPGTGDVPLTVFQSVPVDAIIIVTSPQELVSMIVEKAVKMAGMMNIKIAGIIENMSYVQCPDCEKHINIFGESHVKDIALQYDIPVLAQIPLNPQLASLVDSGKIEDFNGDWLECASDIISSL
jgi:Mrp family chromosome partitioning ATPase